MTLKECYDEMEGNYDEVKGRLQMDKLVEKFMLKFRDEGTMQKLLNAVAIGDIEESFRCAHSMKGIAANIGLPSLQQAASDLTEQLRPRAQQADPALVTALKEKYELAINTIDRYKAEM